MMALRLIEFVIKLLILICLQYNSFLNAIRLKKICAKAVNTCHFEFYPVPYRYNTQEMSKEAIDNFLPALKFFPHWFVTNKIIKKVDNTLSLMIIYPFLMKILIMPIF